MLLGKKIILSAIIIFVVVFAIYLYHQLSRPLSEDKFVQIYVELNLLQTEPELSGNSFSKMKEEIFKKYKADQKDLEKFIQDYKNNPEKWVEIWRKINQKLKEKVESN
ncbi:MAG: hypothetical protein AMJ90_08420 [candidate division Zixibacteria bacterium SM23_73_2]|nr:MAG: hypothetical protein AMJ90_08420 [candidate division Zixibacteria bacterium SM23_73_2]